MIKTDHQKIEILAKELYIDSVQEGRKPFLKYKGQSMMPLLKEGDEVFFEKERKISFGDLVVYRHNSHFIVHRFILKRRIGKKEFFILKADNFLEFDKPVAEDNIVGRVTKLKRDEKILSFDTSRGRFKNLFYFFISYPRVLFRKITYKKYDFVNERKILRLSIKNALSDSERLELSNLFRENLDWQYIANRVKFNFFSHIFIKTLTDLGIIGFLPEKIQDELENMNRLQLVHDVRVRDALYRLLNEFNRQKIDVLILKGAQVGIELYRDSSYRWMGDIDLLVKEEDWLRACHTIFALGFRMRALERNYNKLPLRYLDNHIDFHMDGIRLELKSNIWAIDFPYFDYCFWQNARPINLNNLKVYFPSLENTLLLACVNLARHNFSGFIWFYDIKEIINKFRYSLNWEDFLNLIKRCDLATLVYYSLHLTSKLMGANLPEEILLKIKPNFIRAKLFEFFWDRDAISLNKEGPTFRAKIPFEFILVLFCGKFSLRLKRFIVYLRYLLKIIFPPKNYMKERFKLKSSGFVLMKAYFLRLSAFLFKTVETFLDLIFRKY
ncbi:MAG: nucleotidyltransferase family protein [Candidatus Omnitrophota bacterium]